MKQIAPIVDRLARYVTVLRGVFKIASQTSEPMLMEHEFIRLAAHPLLVCVRHYALFSGLGLLTLASISSRVCSTSRLACSSQPHFCT